LASRLLAGGGAFVFASFLGGAIWLLVDSGAELDLPFLVFTLLGPLLGVISSVSFIVHLGGEEGRGEEGGGGLGVGVEMVLAPLLCLAMLAHVLRAIPGAPGWELVPSALVLVGVAVCYSWVLVARDTAGRRARVGVLAFTAAAALLSFFLAAVAPILLTGVEVVMGAVAALAWLLGMFLLDSLSLLYSYVSFLLAASSAAVLAFTVGMMGLVLVPLASLLLVLALALVVSMRAEHTVFAAAQDQLRG